MKEVDTIGKCRKIRDMNSVSFKNNSSTRKGILNVVTGRFARYPVRPN